MRHIADILHRPSLSALIIGRLMWHERMVRLHHVDEISGPSIQRTVVRTIIQSEALYSATIVGTLVSCAARSESFFVCTSMVAPLVVRALGIFPTYLYLPRLYL